MHYPDNKKFHELLDRVQYAIDTNFPVCLYRKPFETEVKAVFQSSRKVYYASDFDKRGFVFAPYKSGESPVLLIPDDEAKAPFTIAKIETAADSFPSYDAGKSEYLELVQKAIDTLCSGPLQKVVLSRKIEVKVEVDIKILTVRLLNLYPSAFCYLFFHPQTGLWIGATPETFMEVVGGRLKTMSLAGTLPYEEEQEPQWSEKERLEQQVVTTFIKNKLSAEVHDLEISGPQTILAGKLWHLKSEFQGRLSDSTSIKKIVDLLHPTPAVCGYPRDLAKTFIQENESYQRMYYTGYLGELNKGRDLTSSFYVNLRCMQLFGDRVHIYVGGGITSGSSPVKEWEETQNKSRTMMNIL